jgi:ferredoxin
MKLQVDVSGCMGNARCAAVAPKLFTLDEDGYVTTETIDVPEGQEHEAHQAVESCPEQIIAVAEDAS